ncbi:peptide deformylase [Candidatus Parcubacteria bacterium]|nr:peptide deformylase [Candidatus Parcubacteria bacterium]
MPKILEIITNPNKILRQKSENIKSDKIQEYDELINDMVLSMVKLDGIGLAAPQIGKNIKIVIINMRNGVVAMINPKILKKSIFKEWGEEGCLSVPNTFGKVRRYKKVTCEYLDRTGIKHKIEAKGLMARVIQHEIDHLNGILFIDLAKNIKTLKQA